MKRSIYTTIAIIALFSQGMMYASSPKTVKKTITNQHIKQSDIQTFATVLAQIQYFYIKQVSYEKLFSDAISGMLSKLDPHSAYLSPKDLEYLTSTSKGQFAGIGISLIVEDNLLRVITPLDDSPAKKAGIQTNDIIFKVNGNIISQIGAKKALELIKGKPGTIVKLSVYRTKDKKILNLTIKRAIIKLTTVSAKLINGDLGYIRISSFSDTTQSEIKTSLNKLQKEARKYRKQGALKGLIIDVRNNPGGLLDAAIHVTDLFLDAAKLKNKTIVSTKGRIAEFNLISNATNGDILKGLPIVVLINHGSASAAEILAAALGDHNRALLLGTQTFGKGSVQTVLPSGKESAIKLTTALYYTPHDIAIQAKGITPDIRVEPLVIQPTDSKKTLQDIISEATLMNHISAKKPAKSPGPKQQLNSRQINDLASKDFQLYEAAKILETLIMSKKLN